MSNQTIAKNNKQYRLYESFENLDQFPNKCLDLKQNIFGYYLEESNDLITPEKVYSNDTIFINHVVDSYKKGSNSVGVLLSGKKGLGKTFTAKIIAKKLDIMVIKITENPKNMGFLDFLNKIKQDFVLLIDEFEKIFPNNNNSKEEGTITQDKFLSFLDGLNSSSSKKMFIITSNSDVNEFFINRPSRIRYKRHYDKISIDVVKEIIEDLLTDKTHSADLLKNLELDALNIDIIIKIIEEINLLNKPYSEFKSFFNYYAGNSKYDIFDNITNVKITTKNFNNDLSAQLEALIKANDYLFYVTIKGDEEKYYYPTEIKSQIYDDFIVECEVRDDDNCILENQVIRISSKTIKLNSVYGYQ